MIVEGNWHDQCTVQRVNWVSIAEPRFPSKHKCAIAPPSVPLTVLPLTLRVKLVFDEPQFSITAGQAQLFGDEHRFGWRHY